MQRKILALSVAVLWLGWDVAVGGEVVCGVVVKVYDGDTIAIVGEDWEEVCVRFQAVDAPDKGQPGYREAQVFLAKMLHGEEVRIEIEKQDRYKRKVGRIYLGEVDIEYCLIRAGLAWHYDRYNREKKLADAQKQAQEEKIGIWQDANPIHPHEWRKMKRAKAFE